jgi:N-acetylmuramoyl-L-alanine amidase
VLEPVGDGVNDAVVAPSAILARDIRAAILSGSVEQVSTYDGTDGLQPRQDLAGLNLSTVPKVLVECANMRNPADAGVIVSPTWQRAVAAALARGLTRFLQTG